MKINHQQLKEKYEELSTDQLLQIKVTSELTDMATMLLDDELKRRDVNINDYNLAIKDAKIVQADRDSQKKGIKRKIQFHFIYLAILAIFVLYYNYFD